MPSSSSTDPSSVTSNHDHKAAKVTQKSKQDQTSSSKGKKNGKAKDASVGGVMAAVRKEAEL